MDGWPNTFFLRPLGREGQKKEEEEDKEEEEEEEEKQKH